MSGIDEVKFHLWDRSGAVESLIERWQPENCRTEKDYENSLYEFLHQELPNIQITKQFAKGRVRADILVSDNVVLELKNNLDSTAKYQRLLGQLAELKEWKGTIIVLLCGNTDPNLTKALRQHVKDWTGDYFIVESKVTVVEKYEPSNI